MSEKQELTPGEGRDRLGELFKEILSEKYKLREPQAWDIKQVALYLGRSHRTVYNQISLERKKPVENPLPVTVKGRTLLFNNNLIILWAKYRLVDEWIKEFRRKRKAANKK